MRKGGIDYSPQWRYRSHQSRALMLWLLLPCSTRLASYAIAPNPPVIRIEEEIKFHAESSCPPPHPPSVSSGHMRGDWEVDDCSWC